MLIILVYLGALVSVYSTMNTRTCDSLLQWATLAAGVACNASWVLIASCANAFTVGRARGWQDPGGRKLCNVQGTNSIYKELIQHTRESFNIS